MPATLITYSVVAPTRPGTYNERFGWLVKDSTGWTVYSGSERGARNTAKALNKRAFKDAATR